MQVYKRKRKSEKNNATMYEKKKWKKRKTTHKHLRREVKCAYTKKKNDFSLEVNSAILEAFWISEPLAVFIALILVGLNKLLKQRIYVRLNGVKNPTWLETN